MPFTSIPRLAVAPRLRRTLIMILSLTAILTVTPAWSQATQPDGVFADAQVETVSKAHYKFVEGPAAFPDGSIAFSDIPNQHIHRYDPETGETELMHKETGGANGLISVPLPDDDDAIIGCAGTARELRLFTTGRSARLGFDPAGPRGADVPNFNTTNDITGSLEHGFYFTDPAYGGKKPGAPDVEAVYYTTLEKQGGVWQFVDCQKVEDTLKRPNGIQLGADGKTLYVADHAARKIFAYDVDKPGEVSNRRLLIDLDTVTDAAGEPLKHDGPDGMILKPASVDAPGHLFIALFNAGILAVDKEGKQVGFLPIGEHTTNCVFGKDGHLYVTAKKSLIRVVFRDSEADGKRP